MLISPPFLPAEEVADDAELLRAMMVGGLPDDGAFPVSMELSWHGGIHLTAPPDGKGVLPVRAVADGTVVFARDATPEPNPPKPDDPLNYYKGWTNDGCVVLSHKTEIGEGANAAISYYSVYMHLSDVAESTGPHDKGVKLKKGDTVWRKDPVGAAGLIYGAQNKIHFEIVFDTANLQKLIGRDPAVALDTTRDGRTDSVWGEVYVLLPKGSGIHAENIPAQQRRAARLTRRADNGEAANPNPEAHAREAEAALKKDPTNKDLKRKAIDARAQVTSLPKLRQEATQQTERYTALNTGKATSQTDEVLIVGLRYHLGGCTVTTYKEDGTEIGTALEESNDYEYDLFNEAMTLFKKSPSAGYDLLRFGRKLGPDAVSSENTAHWRMINYPGGQGSVDLNITGTSKFSDADFPPWKRWIFAQDDDDANSRCDSKIVKDLILNEGVACYADSLAPARLKLDTVQRKLQCVVCQIPSEWDKEKIDERWGWLKKTDAAQQTDLLTQPLDETAFARLKAHISKLAFWKDAGLPDPAWHVNPRKFVEVMRTCGWLTLQELASLLPRFYYDDFPVEKNTRGTVDWDSAQGRWRNYYVEFNKMMRKYGFTSARRQAQLLAQVYIETALLRTMREFGSALPTKKKDGTYKWAVPTMEYYTVFYGHGMMQLTWPANYEGYLKYRTNNNLPDNSDGNYVDRPSMKSTDKPRLTRTSDHYWTDPRDANKKIVGKKQVWFPRYDPDLIASNIYNACDSAGFFWVSTYIGIGQISMMRVADRALDSDSIGTCSKLVNGGGYGYFARQAFARYVWRFRSDSVETVASKTVSVTKVVGHSVETKDVLTNYARQSP